MNYFEKNIGILKEKDLAIAKRVLATEDNPALSIIYTKGGFPTLMVTDNKGEKKFIHNPIDPVGEAKRLLNGATFRGEDGTVLFGFGMGYLVREILNKMEPEHILLVVEPRLDIFRTAIKNIDLSSIFSDDRFKIFTGEDLFSLFDTLQFYQFKILAGDIKKLIYPVLKDLSPQKYERIEDQIEKYILSIKTNFSTLTAHSKKCLRNILANLPVIIESAPVKNLFNQIQGKPAIVIAAGPSLDNNIDTLQRAKGKALLVAVDTALKPLLAREIVPDVVVSADPLEINFLKIKELRNIDSSCLVYHPEVYFEIPKRFKGARFVIGGQNTFSKWLLGLKGEVGDIPASFTVSHVGFFLVRAMGADPIIFAGLDLSFPDERHHVSGSTKIWAPKLDSSDIRWVPDIYGGRVKTTDGFINMITMFEHEIARTNALCIDATEGGAFIRGTQIMTMEEALHNYCKGSFLDIRGILTQAYSVDSYPVNEKIANGLKWLISEAHKVSNLCDQTFPLIDTALNLITDDRYFDDTFSDIVSRINDYDKMIQGHKKFLDIVEDQLADLILFQTKEYFEIRRVTDYKEKLTRELQKSRRFFTDVKTVADDLKEFCH
ncbi:MAG: motility associated factor glycosyltransferase family protein [Deltaproteobacteria bacterium]|nr:motility associated factor glycosyltransferase family protein [Deltaproteobacteria bacterium]MBW2073118.1 motility associated factor glycosyltransferase family protein [Deltaproteobacteria bacterium]